MDQLGILWAGNWERQKSLKCKYGKIKLKKQKKMLKNKKNK